MSYQCEVSFRALFFHYQLTHLTGNHTSLLAFGGHSELDNFAFRRCSIFHLWAGLFPKFYINYIFNKNVQMRYHCSSSISWHISREIILGLHSLAAALLQSFWSQQLQILFNQILFWLNISECQCFKSLLLSILLLLLLLFCESKINYFTVQCWCSECCKWV